MTLERAAASRHRSAKSRAVAATNGATAASPAPISQRQKSLHRWTFMTNHSHVLLLLSRDSSLVLREVAWQVGITERAVQRILADLEADGFIEREKIGRKNHYRILTKQPLRHPIVSHRSTGDLITLVNDSRTLPAPAETFRHDRGWQASANSDLPVTFAAGAPHRNARGRDD